MICKMRNRNNPSAFFIAFIFIITSIVRCPAASLSEWRQDIDEIVRDIITYHPDPFTKTGKTVFLRAAEKLKDDLPDLSEEQRMARAMRLVALIGDGHTQLEPNNPLFAFWYPVRIEEFTDGYFVTSAHKSVADLAGAQVLEIAGRTAEEVVNEARKLIDTENEFDRKRRLFAVHSAALMKGLGYTEANGDLKVKFKLRDGQIVERRLPPRKADDPRYKSQESSFEWEYRGEMFGMPFDTAKDWISAFKNLPAAAFQMFDAARPLHLTQRIPYVARQVPEKDAYYIQANQLDDTRFIPSLRRSLQDVDKLRPRRLILDFRYNFGGDGSVTNLMVDEFVQRQDNPPWKEVYLLTGRKSFSAAIMAIDAFLKHVKLTVVGEPAGAALNSFGDAEAHKYPKTGMLLYVSTLRHQLSSSNDLSEIIPVDVPAPFSFADYAAGRDPAIDPILNGEEMRSIAIIARIDGGAAARKAYEERKTGFARYSWWAPPKEIDLRFVCRTLLEDKRIQDGLETCRLNAEIHPFIWNVWYNLGAAQKDAGLVAERIQSYRRVLELDPANHNGIALRQAIADGLKPGVIRYGAAVADVEKALTGLCKTINTRRINPPFTILKDIVRDKQMQIDCEDFSFFGKPRHAEFVFADDSLEMAWILTDKEDEPAILKAMTDINGEPANRNDKFIAFAAGHTALRIDRSEVLFYSEKLAPGVLSWFSKNSTFN